MFAEKSGGEWEKGIGASALRRSPEGMLLQDLKFPVDEVADIFQCPFIVGEFAAVEHEHGAEHQGADHQGLALPDLVGEVVGLLDGGHDLLRAAVDLAGPAVVQIVEVGVFQHQGLAIVGMLHEEPGVGHGDLHHPGPGIVGTGGQDLILDHRPLAVDVVDDGADEFPLVLEMLVRGRRGYLACRCHTADGEAVGTVGVDFFDSSLDQRSAQVIISFSSHKILRYHCL